MSFRTLNSAWTVAGVILSTLVSSHGQQPPPRRGQPILFSEPRADTATSNLNEIVTQKRSPKNLEQEPQKTLDIFSVGDPGANMIMPPLRQLPPPNVNSKRLKELLDKRKDRGFESPEDLVTGLTAEEIFKVPELDRDGQEKKKTTAMERYYQRLEREHLGNTNQMKGDDLFGRQKQNDGRDDLTFFGTEKTPGVAGNATAPILKPLFGDDSLSAFSPDMNKSGSFSESFGFANVESPATTRARETRLQDFRELLSPPVTRGAAVNPFNSAATAPPGVTPFGMDSLPGATPRGSLPTTTVGAPLAFPGSAANRQNLTPPPPPRMPLPPPAFELPKRKF
jgi:hypothetical protein